LSWLEKAYRKSAKYTLHALVVFCALFFLAFFLPIYTGNLLFLSLLAPAYFILVWYIFVGDYDLQEAWLRKQQEIYLKEREYLNRGE